MIYAQSKAQSDNLVNDMLQGKWWFKSLSISGAINLNGELQSYASDSIQFIFHNDTITIIKRMFLYTNFDSSSYLTSVETSFLSFYSLRDSKKKKPLNQFAINLLGNQELILIAREVSKQNQSLFLNFKIYSFTFSRNKDLNLKTANQQQELIGRWYCNFNFLNVVDSLDTLIISSKPHYYEISIDENNGDTTYRYRILNFSNEEIEFDDSTYIAENINSKFIGLYDRASYYFSVPECSYSIIPSKKLIELNNCYYTNFPHEKKFLFHYELRNDKLILIRIRN